MRNQAARRGDMAGGRNDDLDYGQNGEWSQDDYTLRGGHHYGEPQPEAEYDPRAYAPNPDEPYGYDDAGNPLYYQSEPQDYRKPNRNGVVMAGAVMAFVALAGVGFAAYKYVGHGGSNGEPPLIRADSEPVKTVPQNPGGAEMPQQNKAIYDRVDPAAPNSKVVSREEEPVDLPSAPSSEPRDGSRIILPGGPASAENTPPSTEGSEPRRVKTMAIRPLGSSPAAPAGDPISEAARTGQAPRGSEFDNGIMADGEPAPRQSEPRLAAAPTRTPAPAAAPAAAPRPAPQQPAPQAARPTPPAPTPAPAAQRADPQQVAAVAPRAPAPAATAAQPRPAAAGTGFVVQVTSQRSEADARTAFSSLQRRFPQVLGPYQPSIQSANVGDRGTYYRVRVGPFGSSADASTVCNNLRAAGGDCVVSRN